MLSLEVPGLGKCREAPVVGLLYVIVETTGRELFGGEMITQAVTTCAFSAAAGITTIAVLEILFFFAFHNNSLQYSKFLVAL